MTTRAINALHRRIASLVRQNDAEFEAIRITKEALARAEEFIAENLEEIAEIEQALAQLKAEAARVELAQLHQLEPPDGV